MVAFDPNAPETPGAAGLADARPVHAARHASGAPYEFLWANPYQPGLSYYHVPLIYHNPDFGRLFVRSSWDDVGRVVRLLRRRDADVFSEGQLTVLNPRQIDKPPSPSARR